ncbi:restriction endonuclease subunit S [Ruegeria atlantica]|uniref:restriction endonuclease subunit S n=1 Tax=Ruegeria atlantica TaxID=81569 RepID=UPI002493F29D|nr:restriction endonuclease subunit S [Ruegeria atlantica]
MKDLVKSGWQTMQLGEVCSLLNGRAYKKPELLESGRYPVLRVGNFFTNNHWYYSDLELDENKYCDNGDLLYAWSASFGPRIWNGGKVIYHYHIWKVAPSEQVLRDYLFYFFDWDKERIKEEQGAGATMIHVSKRSMEARAIPVPPLEEQRRIVAVLDEAFEGLARAKENAEVNLQNSRELFSLSFEHELIASADQSKLTTIGEACSGFEYGTSAKSKNSGIVPVLRMGNLQSGEIDWGNLVYTDNVADIEKLNLKNGDVLFNRTNSLEHVGKAAIYRGERQAIFAGYLIRLQFDREKLLPEFLNMFLNSRGARNYGRSISGKSVNQANISASKLKTYPMRLPSFDVQKEIVRKAEKMREPIDDLAAQYVTQIRDFDDLRQSLLQKAFAGELT